MSGDCLEPEEEPVSAESWPIDNIWNLLGRKEIRRQSVILLCEVGSSIHGISVAGYDDLDLIAIRIEEWTELINGPERRQAMMVRTKPEGVRSRFGDIDIQVYTLRKFVGLALGGNPSILTALFSPERRTADTAQWDKLARLVPSRLAGKAFLGYMRQQMERWQGTRGQRNVNRPELVEAFGFDTKYAGHVIRLGIQGAEYVSTARMTLPMPAADAVVVRSVREGKHTEEEALDIARQVEADLLAAIARSPLPEQPATIAAQAWLADRYEKHYRILHP